MHHVCIAKIVIDSRHFLLCLSSQDCEAIIGLSAEVFDLTVVQLKWPFKLFKIRQMDLLRFKWMKKDCDVRTRLRSFWREALSPPFSSPVHFSDFTMMSSLDLLNFRTRSVKLGLKKWVEAASLFCCLRTGCGVTERRCVTPTDDVLELKISVKGERRKY